MASDLPASRALNARREPGACPAATGHFADVLLRRTDGSSHSNLSAYDCNGSGDGVIGVIHAADATTKVVVSSTPKSVKHLNNDGCKIAPMLTLADRIRISREELGISQAELARRVGTSQQTIAKIENGLTRNPRFIVEISDALGVNPMWLKGRSETKAPVVTIKRIKDELVDVPAERLPEILKAVQDAKKAG